MAGSIEVLHHDPAVGHLALAHVTPHTSVQDAVGRDASFDTLGRRTGRVLGEFSSAFRAGSTGARPYAAMQRSAASQTSAWSQEEAFIAAVDGCVSAGDASTRAAAVRFIRECREQRSFPCMGGITISHIAAVGPGRRQDDESWAPGTGAGVDVAAGGAPDPWAMEEGPIDAEAKGQMMQALGLADEFPAESGTGEGAGNKTSRAAAKAEAEAATTAQEAVDDAEDDGSDVRVTFVP